MSRSPRALIGPRAVLAGLVAFVCLGCWGCSSNSDASSSVPPTVTSVPTVAAPYVSQSPLNCPTLSAKCTAPGTVQTLPPLPVGLPTTNTRGPLTVQGDKLASGAYMCAAGLYSWRDAGGGQIRMAGYVSDSTDIAFFITGQTGTFTYTGSMDDAGSFVMTEPTRVGTPKTLTLGTPGYSCIVPHVAG